MKNKSFCFKTLLLSTILTASLFVGCGSDASSSNNNLDESTKSSQDQAPPSETNSKSLSEQIDEILNKDSISKKELKTAYTLAKELEKENEAQAKNYIMDMKYCMYDYDPYGLEDGYTVWATSLENAKEQLSCFYGTWYENGTDKVINFTASGINERPYYVYSMYSDFATMLIFGYLDEPEKLYCMAAESEYYEDIYGNGENVDSISFYSDYVPGLEKENDNTFWCEYDSAALGGIMNDWNEYLEEETYDTSSLLIYEELISNSIVPSFDGANTTDVLGDGNYFDEIVSRAWFDEYGQPIATFMPTDLTETLFYKGYYARLENLHFVDGHNVTLDYVKRYGYSTDAFLDEVYALILTDVYKREDNKGNKFFEGTEYYSGETVIIQGSFNGLMNDDSVMIIGPLHGLGSDDTANFTGVWCELINDRFSGYIPEDTGFSEWSDTTYEEYGTADVFDGYEANIYEMCDYLYGVNGSPEDFFKDVGLPCYTQIGVDGTTYISVTKDNFSVLFRIYEYSGETEYACNINSEVKGIDSSNVRIAGFNLFMSYSEVLQLLENNGWTYCIEDDLIKAEQGDCELFVTFYQDSISGIDYFEKAGYWYENNGI